MILAEGIVLDYVDGKVMLSAEVRALVAPALDSIKAKVESGEIDPIKGTDLDKQALLKAIEYIKSVI